MDKANIDIKILPAKIAVFLKDAAIYSSNGCSDEKTFFIDGNIKCYLKTGKPEHLSREAKMTEFLQPKGLSPEVVAFELQNNLAYLVTKAFSGLDGTAEQCLGKPQQLARVFGESLRLLHSQEIKDCPYPDKSQEFIENAINLTRVKPEVNDYLQKNAYLLQNDTVIHGDYCLPNIILNNHEFVGFVDLGYGGIGDRHFDIDYGLWTLNYNLKTDEYNDIFIKAYGVDNIDEHRLKLCDVINRCL